MTWVLNRKRLSSSKCLCIGLILYWFGANTLQAQSSKINFAFKVGLIVEYGTHVSRIGAMASTATSFEATQFNAELRAYYNFKSYGPPKRGVETVWALGIAQGFGKPYLEAYPLVDSRYFNTERFYALGFTFQKYKDKIETSQGTGSVFFAAESFFLNFENDLFGNRHGRDRFRTGGFSLNYFHDRWLYSLKNIIWTGETRCAEKRSYTDTDYPSRYGYQDVTKCRYGTYAHGIAAFSVSYVPEDWFGQIFNFSLGLDHERIRHFFQNRIIHDMYFMPDAINPSKNLHYPMLAEDGSPYLFLKDQILKKGKLYLQTGANTHLLY